MATITQSFEGHTGRIFWLETTFIGHRVKIRANTNHSNPRWHCFKGPKFLLFDNINAKVGRGDGSSGSICMLSKSKWIPKRGPAQRGCLASHREPPAVPVIAYWSLAEQAPCPHQIAQQRICIKHWLCSFGQSYFLTDAAQCIFTASFISFRIQTHFNRAKSSHTPLQISARKPAHKNWICPDFSGITQLKNVTVSLYDVPDWILVTTFFSIHKLAIKMA